jgi:hypothetical protein
VLSGGADDLAPAYELVYLCMHAAKDGWSELKWAIDIALLTKSFTPADWRFAWELAARFRLRRMLLAGLALTEWLTGECYSRVDVLKGVPYWPSPRNLARLRARAMNAPERKASCLGLNRTYLALCDSNRDRLVYLFRVFSYPQPRDFVSLGLKPALLPVWPLLRPLAICGYCMARSLALLFVPGR